MAKLIDRRGHVYGRLTVIERAAGYVNPPRWLCRCECGTTVVVRAFDLAHRTRSCGCLRRDKAAAMHTTHGLTRGGAYPAELRAYHLMVRRCENQNTPEYPYYGGRGVTVCARWRESSSAFLADMGPKPSPGHSLGRINNDEGYGPDNCRWETREEQARNKSNNRLVTIDGETHPLSVWAERFGVSYALAHNRVYQLGWEPERAVRTPPDPISSAKGRRRWAVANQNAQRRPKSA